MKNFLGIEAWSVPSLVIPSGLWESQGLGYGFLTPTPIWVSTHLIRVFGGVRDSLGRSAIYWVDLDSTSLSVVDFGEAPCLDTRGSLDFDTDGAILGEIYSEGSSLKMLYVGFRKSKDVKFQAFTGLAESTDLGKSWKKLKSPFAYLYEGKQACDIFAIHSVRKNERQLEMYLAVGTGWETISGNQYPRYKTFILKGKHLDSLELSSESILPELNGVYRLGRPRFFESVATGEKFLIATGGKRNGDYRPYVFSRINHVWKLHENQFIIEPGYSDNFSTQVSYPAPIQELNRIIVFFNGDNMGKQGAYASIGTIQNYSGSETRGSL